MTTATATVSLNGRNAFLPHEVLLATAFSTLMIVGFFVLLALAGMNAHEIQAKEPPLPEAIPMKVKPVMDDLPLLKLGGKKVRAKLPEMWKKNPPVQRFEAKSAPSTKASKDIDNLPTSPLAKRDAEAPPPDAEVAKEVDQVLLDAGPDAEPVVDGEGSPDGVKEGTETDPLKARAVSQYMMKLLTWFNSRFRAPAEGAPCEELKKLTAGVAVQVGGDRRIAGYSLSSPSGNPVFDAKVRSTMDNLIGQELPPPPPLYPDILGATVSPRFSGRDSPCKSSAPDSEPNPAPAPEAPAPEAPAPEAPAPESAPAPEPELP